LKFLICGIGSIGYRHMSILRSLGDYKIAAFRTGKSTLPKREHQPDKIFWDLTEALDDKPEAVIVTNPTSMHLQIARSVAERGIPLMIEKPLSNNMEGVSAFRDLCREKKTPVLLAYQLMHHPAIVKMHELVNAKSIGSVLSAKSHWGSYLPEWHPWEDYKASYASLCELGGGVTLTMCHELNFLTSLFGEAKTVKALEVTHNILGIETEEAVDIIIKHDSGIVSNVHLNFYQKPQRRYCELIGTEGTLLWDYDKPSLELLFEGRPNKTISFQSAGDELQMVGYVDQMKHFIRVAQGKEEPRVSLDKGISDLELCTSVLKEIGRCR
jgi:predicted dehydrogenase